MYRECGKAMEKVKHILNMCEPKGFSLYSLPKMSKGAVEVMRAIQRTVLCSAVRILRLHLSIEGLGPGR